MLIIKHLISYENKNYVEKKCYNNNWLEGMI